jgi:hypothetical protein
LVSVEKFEGRVLSVSMVSAVVGKFDHWEFFCPGFWVDSAKNRQIRLDLSLGSPFR